MQHHVAEVEQGPASVVRALAAEKAPATLLHDLVDMVCNGVHLTIAATTDDADVVGVTGPARHVDKHGQKRLFGQRSANRGAGRGQRFTLCLRATRS